MKKEAFSVIFVLMILIGMSGYFTDITFGETFNKSSFVKEFDKAVEDGYLRVHEDAMNITKSIRISRDAIGGLFNNILFSNECISLNGLFQKAIGRRVIIDAVPSNDVVRLNNGMLSFVNPKFDDIKTSSSKVINFNNRLKAKGIDMVYVQAPFKIISDDMLPAGVPDYTNENADKFLAAIEERGVKTFDLRDEFLKDDTVSSKFVFFLTDHHWRAEGGLWGFTKVGAFLNENYDFGIDPEVLEMENYYFETKEKWFLGSQGKRVGIYFGGIDDFTLITPKARTKFRFEMVYEEVSREGNFPEAMFAGWHVEDKEYFANNPYAMYTGGNYGYSIIKNQGNPDGKKIFLIRDSFSCVFSPFLGLGCSEVQMVDLRYFKDDLLETIEKAEPDLVMFMYNADMYNDGTIDTMFNFYNN